MFVFIAQGRITAAKKHAYHSDYKANKEIHSILKIRSYEEYTSQLNE